MRRLLEQNEQLLYVLRSALEMAGIDAAGLIALGPDMGYGELLMLTPLDNWQAAILHGPLVSVIKTRSIEEVRGDGMPVLVPYSSRPVRLSHAVALPVLPRIILWVDKKKGLFDESAMDVLRAAAGLCADHLDKTILLEQAQKRVQSASSAVESIIKIQETHDIRKMAEELVKVTMRITTVHTAFFAVADAGTHKASIITAMGKNSRKFINKTFNLNESLVGLALNTGSELPNDGIFQRGMTHLFGHKLSNPVSFDEGLIVIPIVMDKEFMGALIAIGNGLSDSYTRFYLRNATNALAQRAVILRELQESIDRSLFDPMTGLYTKAAASVRINEILAAARRYSRSLSVMMLDLDHFKKVNDTYGHQVGDRVLLYTTQQIIKNLRGSDMAARYGGEEFLVILPETQKTEAIAIAERIRASLEAAPVPVGTHSLRVTASIGVTCCENGGCTIDEIIRAADQNLYRAKKSGRNRVIA